MSPPPSDGVVAGPGLTLPTAKEETPALANPAVLFAVCADGGRPFFNAATSWVEVATISCAFKASSSKRSVSIIISKANDVKQ
jgi:hypothetical protein